MRLYLSSFRIGDHPEILIKLAGDHRRTAMIANAIDHLPAEVRTARVEEELGRLREVGLEPYELDLRRFSGRPGSLREALDGVGIVWLRGGNVFVLRHRLAESGFDQLLLEVLGADRYVVGGYSAGVCVLGTTLAGLEACDPLADLEQVAPGAEPVIDGLGILDGTVVPHLDSPEHPESAVLTSVADELRGAGRTLIELRDGDVLLITDDNRALLPRARH
ncbi:Type 1 glutamine amidotransferase-like domain-containing protein [Microlunatus parietis]|uniref:Dipeptidase E n=1 Tax=Microlunatus parietis TaxID=682979 RepID=A0A7Y9LAJ5_9ACTN|nr:Type 1 glutamine amidotransferase-like domain-containing protein [Microlunatus parietis]NYE68776.1 dipeptidase E [Microlunatus parietis]